MAKTHILKTLATAWDAVAAGKKPWEIRRNDRFFQTGDIVVLRKIHDLHDLLTPGALVENHEDVGSHYFDLTFRIGWMLQGDMLYGLEPGFCVFSLEPLEPKKTLYWADMDGEWVFTEDRSELTDDLDLGVISRAIHSSADPHMQWAVRIPIETDEDGCVLDDELRWFNTYADAQDAVDYINGPGEDLPPPVTPPSAVEGADHG